MLSRILVTAGLIVLLAPFALMAQESGTSTGLMVEEMTFCTGIEEREPVGEASEFTTELERVWCWTNIVGATDTTLVTHKWYWEGENVAEVELEIRYPRMRTWSYKTITPEMIGNWKVEVVDPDGVILTEKSFTIK
jgi:hypothetical protein